MRHIRFEIIIDKLVPYSLAFIIIHLILSFFFVDFLYNVEELVIFLEVFLITFVLGFDLIFKYRRSTNKGYFFKHHWLEILAVFPFMLIFRLFEEVYLVTRLASTEASLVGTQSVLHDVRGVDQGLKIARDAELSGRASRASMFSKPFSFIRRVPRLIRGAIFFEHPLTNKNKKYHKIHYAFYSKHAKKLLNN